MKNTYKIIGLIIILMFSFFLTYKIKTICVTRLFGLLCGLTSMTEITNNFNSDVCIKNISNISGQKLDELPY